MRVRYRHDTVIEARAEKLLAEYERDCGHRVEPPIPVTDIVELHLDFGLDYEDLAKRYGPAARGLLGVTEVETRQILVTPALDPTKYPHRLGRYRFTVAHEIGHYDLHLDEYMSQQLQLALLAIRREWRGDGRPAMTCTPSRRDHAEIQADKFAGYLLMPGRFVSDAWSDVAPRLPPYDPPTATSLDRTTFERELAGCGLPDRFEVSAEAARIRLEQMGLLRSGTPPAACSFALRDPGCNVSAFRPTSQDEASSLP